MVMWVCLIIIDRVFTQTLTIVLIFIDLIIVNLDVRFGILIEGECEIIDIMLYIMWEIMKEYLRRNEFGEYMILIVMIKNALVYLY